MKKIMIQILIIIIFMTACTEDYKHDDLTSDKIRQNIIDASSNLDTYSADIDMDMNMTLKATGLEMNMQYVLNNKGKVDIKARKLEMLGTTTIEMMGMSEDMDISTYIIGDYAYTNEMGGWMKIPLESENIWDKEDQMKEMIRLVESGSITRLEDETKDGKEYYVIKLNPDLKMVAEMAMKGQADSKFGQKADYDDMIKSYESLIWVNKETFVIERSKSKIEMMMTPDNLGIDDKESIGGEISATINIDVRIYDINKPVRIDLPEEASSAAEVPDIESSDIMTGNLISEITA